jgi:hypothetical protein
VLRLEGKMLVRERAERGRGGLPCVGAERKREGEGSGGPTRRGHAVGKEGREWWQAVCAHALLGGVTVARARRRVAGGGVR